MAYVDITQEQLAKTAAVYFSKADLDDVPAKLWLDYYQAADQLYLRACFDKGLKPISLVRLGAVATALDEIYGTELIPVAYDGDHEWDEVEAWNRTLNEVR
jgi:hypothetical protein